MESDWLDSDDDDQVLNNSPTKAVRGNDTEDLMCASEEMILQKKEKKKVINLRPVERASSSSAWTRKRDLKSQEKAEKKSPKQTPQRSNASNQGKAGTNFAVSMSKITSMEVNALGSASKNTRTRKSKT